MLLRGYCEAITVSWVDGVIMCLMTDIEDTGDGIGDGEGIT